MAPIGSNMYSISESPSLLETLSADNPEKNHVFQSLSLVQKSAENMFLVDRTLKTWKYNTKYESLANYHICIFLVHFMYYIV